MLRLHLCSTLVVESSQCVVVDYYELANLGVNMSGEIQLCFEFYISSFMLYRQSQNVTQRRNEVVLMGYLIFYDKTLITSQQPRNICDCLWPLPFAGQGNQLY